MKYTNQQKTMLRKKLKAAGYGCQINEKQSPFSDKIMTFFYFKLPDGHRVSVSSMGTHGGTVYGAAFYRDHKIAFDIMNEFFENERGI